MIARTEADAAIKIYHFVRRAGCISGDKADDAAAAAVFSYRVAYEGMGATKEDAAKIAAAITAVAARAHHSAKGRGHADSQIVNIITCAAKATVDAARAYRAARDRGGTADAAARIAVFVAAAAVKAYHAAKTKGAADDVAREAAAAAAYAYRIAAG